MRPRDTPAPSNSQRNPQIPKRRQDEGTPCTLTAVERIWHGPATPLQYQIVSVTTVEQIRHNRCRANMAHMRQPRPDYGLDFRENSLNPLKLPPLRSAADGLQRRDSRLQARYSYTPRSNGVYFCPFKTAFNFLREGYRKSRRCSRDTYPESYITKCTSIRRLSLALSMYFSLSNTR